jgi:hypothetical protein
MISHKENIILSKEIISPAGGMEGQKETAIIN